jgi:hypothetical protein
MSRQMLREKLASFQTLQIKTAKVTFKTDDGQDGWDYANYVILFEWCKCKQYIRPFVSDELWRKHLQTAPANTVLRKQIDWIKTFVGIRKFERYIFVVPARSSRQGSRGLHSSPHPAIQAVYLVNPTIQNFKFTSSEDANRDLKSLGSS